MNSEQDKWKLPLILFDSECSLCKRFKEALEKIDHTHKLNFISIHEKSIYQSFPQLDIKDCHDSVHLIDENKKIYKGPEVIEYLIHFYPVVSKFAWLVETNIGKKAIDFFYKTVNELRKSELNPCPSCNRKK